MFSAVFCYDLNPNYRPRQLTKIAKKTFYLMYEVSVKNDDEAADVDAKGVDSWCQMRNIYSLFKKVQAGATDSTTVSAFAMTTSTSLDLVDINSAYHERSADAYLASRAVSHGHIRPRFAHRQPNPYLVAD